MKGLSVLILLFSCSARAALIDLNCVTHPPTTSVYSEETEATVSFTFVNHNGSKYAPYWNSLVVPADIAHMQKKADVISQLDSTVKVEFEKSGCKIVGDNFNCSATGKEFKSGPFTLIPWSIYSTNIEEKVVWGTYKKRQVTLAFQINRESYTLVMDYQPAECKNKVSTL